MACIDLCTGAIVDTTSAHVVFMFTWPYQDPEVVCSYFFTVVVLAYLFAGWSYNGIMFLTIERYLSICYGLKYKHMFTMGKAVLLMGCLFIPRVITQALLLAKTSVIIPSKIVGFEIAIYSITIAVMYIKIFKTVQESAANVRDNGHRQMSSQRANECRLSRRFFRIIVILLCCYLPYGCLSFVPEKNRVDISFYIAYYATCGLIFINSFLNPFLYCWQDCVFRTEVRRIVCCRKEIRVHPGVLTSNRST